MDKRLTVALVTTLCGASFIAGEYYGSNNTYDVLSNGVYLYREGRYPSTKESMQKVHEDMYNRGKELFDKKRYTRFHKR